MQTDEKKKKETENSNKTINEFNEPKISIYW